ncbi:hypothetical protein CCS01_22960 [Rhodopila globiformis]|uniref:N-acetylmuramoyl-L-alanine amidase n=1 Tax=Rhodopila globiformis TaxID=1071 RepID=A0A2S6N2M1_RHOGL|nr:hypothetical protein CCS01_22960 [Rhodopila globiformis]
MFSRRHVLCGAAVSAGLFLARQRPAAARPAHRPQHPAKRQDRRPLIVIDPGHGGKDPGCISPYGTQEKHVALAAGLELRRQLRAAGRYRVAMTRDTDIFIPLDGRVEHARRLGAALFVSLHANASPDPAAHGTCVYRFAWRASDARAASIAHWENSAERYANPVLRGVSRQVMHILALLMRRETQIHSSRFQRDVVQGLARQVTMQPHPAPYARFAVLSAPDIAGVLIEMGFLTNRREETLLRSPAQRQVLARAVRQAVDAYFAAVPYPKQQRG